MPRRKGRRGVQFKADARGDRKSTPTTKGALAAALSACGDPASAVKAIEERSWRSEYVAHFSKALELALAYPALAVKSARAALSYLHGVFEFRSEEGGPCIPLAQAMDSCIAQTYFSAVHIVGSDATESDTGGFSVPYQRRSRHSGLFGPSIGDPIGPKQNLRGVDLLKKVQEWCEFGTAEPSFADAIREVVANPSWLQLKDRVFIVLGASAAMGPCRSLLQLGATVVAVDLNRPPLWRDLIAFARTTPGTLVVPLRRKGTESVPMPMREEGLSDDEAVALSAGCNLLSETPQIAAFLTSLFPGMPLTLGSYAYADGEAHVRISIAMDAIACVLMSRRAAPVQLAYLVSPIDIFAVPKETRDFAEHIYQSDYTSPGRLLGALPALVAPERILRRQFVGDGIVPRGGERPFWMMDSALLQQGPSYMLAKRLQQWRAIVARDSGIRVSLNVAPSSRTKSVMSNPLFAAAYNGANFFDPIEIFDPDTSRALMTLLLLHDLRNPECPSNPQYPLSTPLALISSAAVHGGMWRLPYSLRSIIELAIVLYYLDQYKLRAVGASAALAVAARVLFGGQRARL